MLEAGDDILELGLDLGLGILAPPQPGEGVQRFVMALLDGQPARRFGDEPDGDGNEEGYDVVETEGDEEGGVVGAVLRTVADCVDEKTTELWARSAKHQAGKEGDLHPGTADMYRRQNPEPLLA